MGNFGLAEVLMDNELTDYQSDEGHASDWIPDGHSGCRSRGADGADFEQQRHAGRWRRVDIEQQGRAAAQGALVRPSAALHRTS